MGGQPGRDPPLPQECCGVSLQQVPVLWGHPSQGGFGVSPPCFGSSPRMAWGPPQQCLCFGGSLQDGRGVLLHWGRPPQGDFGGSPQQCLCFGGCPQGGFGIPLASRFPTRMGFGCPQQFSVLWGLPQSTLVSPCLGTPPGMALRLPPRSTQYCGVPPVCGAPPVLPWGRATPTMRPLIWPWNWVLWGDPWTRSRTPGTAVPQKEQGGARVLGPPSPLRSQPWLKPTWLRSGGLRWQPLGSGFHSLAAPQGLSTCRGVNLIALILMGWDVGTTVGWHGGTTPGWPPAAKAVGGCWGVLGSGAGSGLPENQQKSLQPSWKKRINKERNMTFFFFFFFF